MDEAAAISFLATLSLPQRGPISGSAATVGADESDGKQRKISGEEARSDQDVLRSAANSTASGHSVSGTEISQEATLKDFGGDDSTIGKSTPDVREDLQAQRVRAAQDVLRAAETRTEQTVEQVAPAPLPPD